jgi:DNA-directed RNA polymerase specialized sigma24 family protein
VTENQGKPADLDFTQPEAVEDLWDAFYQRLRLAVRERVRNIRRPVASESEIALSAFASFVQRAKDGQFPDLADQDELWRLLKTIAIRKTNDLRKNLRAQKRGGQHAVYNQADLAGDSIAPPAGVDAAPGSEDSPSLELEISDLLQSLLVQLPDDRHRDVILLKLQGASVAMIAEHLSTTTRTVQRMIKKIEDEWQTDLLQT